MRARHIILFFLIGVIIFISGSYGHARLFSNSSDSSFEGGDNTAGKGEATLTCPYTIKELIIKGAEYFFKAQSDINLISEKVELADLEGVDFFSLCLAVNSALQNMNAARYYYYELQYKANHTPYNQAVIGKLMAFDYETFQEKNVLLKDVFFEVKGYLVEGDVRGIYSRTSAYFDTIITSLEDIKIDLEAGIIPTNNHMWSLNQVCTKVHMFGQYVARVFYDIK